MTLIAAMAIWGLNVAAVKDADSASSTRPRWRRCACWWLLRAILGCAVEAMQLAMAHVASGCGDRRLRLLMVYLNQILFAEGLHAIDGHQRRADHGVEPVGLGLLAAVAFGERLTLQRLLGVALGFAGSRPSC